MSNNTYVSDEFDLELWSQFVVQTKINEPQWLLAIFIVSLVLLFILSVIGNLITCIVIFFEKSMHTATNYYLLNLTFSDLIVTFGLWLEIDEYISEGYQFGPMGCKVHFILIILLWNNSILTMTALAIERYIGIIHPMSLKSKPVWRRVIKIITLIWLLAITATVPEYFNVYLVKTHKTTVCFLVPTRLSRVMNGILALVMFIVPLVVMTSVYVAIAVRVSKMEQSTKRDQIFNHRDNSSKINKLIVAMTLSFVICWLPFFIMRVIFFACSMQQIMKLKEWFGIIYHVVTFNCWFGMVLNPVLFSLKSTKFRTALKGLWNARFKKKRSPNTKISTIVPVVK